MEVIHDVRHYQRCSTGYFLSFPSRNEGPQSRRDGYNLRLGEPGGTARRHRQSIGRRTRRRILRAQRRVDRPRPARVKTSPRRYVKGGSDGSHHVTHVHYYSHSHAYSLSSLSSYSIKLTYPHQAYIFSICAPFLSSVVTYIQLQSTTAPPNPTLVSWYRPWTGRERTARRRVFEREGCAVRRK